MIITKYILKIIIAHRWRHFMCVYIRQPTFRLNTTAQIKGIFGCPLHFMTRNGWKHVTPKYAKPVSQESRIDISNNVNYVQIKQFPVERTIFNHELIPQRLLNWQLNFNEQFPVHV